MRLEARGAVSRVALVAAPFAAIAFTLLAVNFVDQRILLGTAEPFGVMGF